jgi:Ca2+-binding EF-hand superfamily protein
VQIRELLKMRGAVGISGLSRNFRIIDTDKSGTLNEAELRKLMNMCKVSLDDDEVRRLFAMFDESGDGTVTYDEFLKQVRGRMGAARRGMVVKVFRTLDELGDGNGFLDVADIKGAFDARASPDVIKGVKTEQQVLREFVSGFEGSKGNRDGMVSLDEWLNYYEELSASIDSDDAFGAMVASVWSALKTIDASGREVCVVRHTPASAIDNLEKMLRVKIWQKRCAHDACTHAAAVERCGLAAPAHATLVSTPRAPAPRVPFPPPTVAHRPQHARQERAQGSRGCLQALRHGQVALHLAR